MWRALRPGGACKAKLASRINGSTIFDMAITKKIFLLLITVFVFSCSSKPIAHTKEEQETLIVGVWERTINQSLSKPFDARIEIRKDDGKITGVISHPSLGCSGRLSMTVHEGDMFEFDQTITQGKKNCWDGKNEIIFIDENTVKRTWFHPDGRGFSTGILKRVKS